MRSETALSHLCADHASQLQPIVALRPFLTFQKEDLRQYCQLNSVPWVEDPTNQDAMFARTRNRIALQGASNVLLSPINAVGFVLMSPVGTAGFVLVSPLDTVGFVPVFRQTSEVRCK
jgi:hypothetical protein